PTVRAWPVRLRGHVLDNKNAMYNLAKGVCDEIWANLLGALFQFNLPLNILWCPMRHSNQLLIRLFRYVRSVHCPDGEDSSLLCHHHISGYAVPNICCLLG